MKTPLNIGIIGAGGRMGRSLLENAANIDGLEVTAAIERPGSDKLGSQLGPQHISVTGNLASRINDCDVIIDFSTPDACMSAIRTAANAGVPVVTGTTGLSAEQQIELRTLATQIPILQAANFSVGVNILARLVELASRASGEEFDLEVFEAHHKHKVDAPSGTALMLGKAAAAGRDLELEKVATWAREGHTGARTSDEIGFQVLRGGDIVGEHTVFVCGAGERIELTHRATDRGIFARGALRAARWLHPQQPGTYDMANVLF
jgi:4-hydroxy-tetrahydrodipicolinate reductase